MARIWATAVFLPVLALLMVTDGRGDPPKHEPFVMETIAIRGASFTMGTPLKKGQPEYHDDEAPQTVTVADFRIGKFPVTARQMCTFLNSEEASKHDRSRLYNHRDIGEYVYSTIALANGQYAPRDGAADAPANAVTWRGAVLFCSWLSAQTGKTYRLPSEAEWELAARGAEQRRWPWGNDDPTAKHGERYSKNRETGLTWTKVLVGSHPANATPEGVHDFLAYIIGEWCANKSIERPSSEQLNDTTVDLDDERTERIVRGYYHRYYRHGSRLVQVATPAMLEYGWRSHLGRPWTRVGCDPVKAVRDAARHGFRVVEEVQRS